MYVCKKVVPNNALDRTAGMAPRLAVASWAGAG
jgi:hypothetical protein